uniref:ORF4 n=1 Tax=Syphacia muris TaxID=451379 RepID=A0A0N5AZB3_9BILA
MELLSLETACIRHVALWPMEDLYFIKQLPKTLQKRIRRLYEDVELFVRLHSGILNIQRYWIVVNDRCEIDWPRTYRKCIDAATTEDAFRFAAANALEQECGWIWLEMNEESRKNLQKSSNAVIRSAAWHAAGYHYLIYYEYVCCTATRNGWANALKLWLSRVPNDEYLRMCTKLSLIAVCHQHYHLLEILPEGDNFPFTFVFPHGHINPDFVCKLANAPARWRRYTLKIARKLLEWASHKDIDRIRMQFYSTSKTAVYGRFIDALLASNKKTVE